MGFTFATSASIHFGAGVSKSIPSFLPNGLRKVFVITGSSPHRHKALFELMSQNGFEVKTYPAGGEPTAASAWDAAKAARLFKAEVVVAIGGGSVIDTGKVVAALQNNDGELMDYLEVVGKGRPLKYPSIPFMAVPTTAGSGAEATRNAVLSIPEAGVKASLRGPYLLPRWAVVDPELTYNLPKHVAAYTGMDAFIQCLEAYLCKQANPLSDGIAREGLSLAARSIEGTCAAVVDRTAKEDLCAASLCGGIALANAKLGSVHGFAGAIGGMIDAPHGAICASLIVPCYKANAKALQAKSPGHPSLAKMEDVARILTGNPSAKANYALAWMEGLFKTLGLKRLGELGFDPSRAKEAVEKSQGSSSMQGNPVELSKHELLDILDEAM